MSFTKKTWVNRAVEYPGRRRLTSVSTDVYDVTREEGSISAEGDAFNATTMNDLENRIEAGFTAAAIVSGVQRKCSAELGFGRRVPVSL